MKKIKKTAEQIIHKTKQATTQSSISLQIKEQEDLQFRRLVENSPHILFIHQDGKIVYANLKAEKDLGLEKASIIGQRVKDLVSLEFQEIVEENLRYLLSGHQEKRIDSLKLISLDGKEIFIECFACAAEFNGKPAVMITGQDITEKKELQAELQKSEQRYKSLFEQNVNCVYSLDLNGYYTSCNDMCHTLSGYSKEKLLTMHYSDLIIPEEHEKVHAYFKKCTKGIPQSFKTSFFNEYGAIIHLSTTIVPIIVNGQITGVFGISQDTTKQVKTEEEIKKMAFQDYLTGLPNRNMLLSQLNAEIDHASSHNQSFVLLFIDLDRFKNINDTLGHYAGDLLLKEVAQRLRFSLGETDMIFRQGGDEFIILLPNADKNLAARAAKQVLDTLLTPFSIHGTDFFISPSIGISVFPGDGKNADTLIKNADFAMYQVKKTGKNNFAFYSFHEEEFKVNPLKIEMELYRAVERNEFFLHYQPKVNLKTGKIIGAEALIRWMHPQLGLVSPASFIPIAEETGLIVPIGEWVLSTACKQNKQWHQKGFSTVVSVNLSARQFAQPNLARKIKQILQETKMDPKYLEIEITESMTADLNRAVHTLHELKKLGLRISIDDFGTGFSSLNYLKQFPVDTLKIDQSFVRNLHSSPEDKTIVNTIISMAHNLNLNVVAEGIETKEQLVFLQQHLCDEGQGYLFTKPLSPLQLEEHMDSVENVVKSLGLPQDINQRNWAQELLRQARKELDETIQMQQGMTFKFKLLDGRFIHTLCDGELLYRLGFIPAQVVGKELEDFLSEEMVKEILPYYEKAWNGEKYVTYESEGNGIFFLAALRPVLRGGEVVEVIGSCVDITERKQMEQELQESQKKYRLMADNMTDLICILDMNGKTLYASPSHQTVLGYPPSHYEGKSSSENIHPDDVETLRAAFHHMIETKQPNNYEFRCMHKNGEWKLFECFVSPVTGDSGKLEHVVAVGRDITEKRKAEEQLWKSEKLQVVGELAAGVAHEIRNPITTVKGFIQLFQKGDIKKEYFDVILPELSRIEEIIKEFLSLAKKQEIRTSYVSIPRLLQEVETLLESEAHLMNIQFSKNIEPHVPQVLCDAHQIKQVFINIIKNSIESIVSSGEIKIKVAACNGFLSVKVSDNGVGVSEERLKKLGEPFYSNKEKGTGMGLMTAFKIIKQHNGAISIQSKENKGTTVEIKLPLL